MKVVCSICGGKLLVDVGCDMAVCTGCGVGYSIARVREMIEKCRQESRFERVETILPEIDSARDLSEDPLWEEVTVEPLCIRIREIVNSGFQMRTLYGVVESGTFDLGTDLYVDDDKNKVCRAYKMECKEISIETAEKDMQIQLVFYGPQVKLLKNAKCLTAPAALSGSVEGEVYFDRLLKTHFKEYTVKKNVRISNKKPSVPASFVLYKESKPVLAIILCSSQIYNDDKIENTMEACGKQGIPVQRYFVDFENARDYVINRIRSEL